MHKLKIRIEYYDAFEDEILRAKEKYFQKTKQKWTEKIST